jgi:uncharacterized protein YacL
MTRFRIPLRFLGLALGLILGFTAGNLLNAIGGTDGSQASLVALGIAVGGIGYLIGPHLSAAVLRGLRSAVAEASTLDIVAVGVGLLFGALMSAALAFPLSFLPSPAGTYLPIFAAAACCAVSVAVVLMRKRDLIAPWFRPRGVARPAAAAQPVPAPAPVVPHPRRLILDTNVVIDGRIGDVVQTGFLDATFIVPRFVLDELQHIADADDPVRRVRGRRGLETLNRLRAERGDLVTVDAEPIPEEREVDAKLIRLAKLRGCPILTNDYNLERVAQLQDIRILNLNELTNALRPIVLPGEEIAVQVIQEGREPGQGVGYLDDGTMVVIDGGRGLVGRQVPVTVTRLLQTNAGRMVFATPKHAVGV